MDQHDEPLLTQKEKHTNKLLSPVIILGVLTLLLLGSVAYLWMQWQAAEDAKLTLQKDKQSLQTQVSELKTAAEKAAASPAPSPQAACNDTPTVAMKDNIKAALDTKNTAAFATYTSDPVKVVFAATEKGGDETPATAAKDLEYTHTATGPWDFNLPAVVLATYDAGDYKDYFDANTYVGKAASGMVAAFDFDCNGKVSQIFVAADAGLL